jgi:hypothetical protein
MAQSTIQKVEKEKFKLTQKPKSLPLENVKRAVPAAIKRAVYQRDQKCLKCGSLNNLNFDHRIPFAMGGKSNRDNIRMLCFSCNQRSRIKMGLHIKAKSQVSLAEAAPALPLYSTVSPMIPYESQMTIQERRPHPQSPDPESRPQ